MRRWITSCSPLPLVLATLTACPSEPREDEPNLTGDDTGSSTGATPADGSTAGPTSDSTDDGQSEGVVDDTSTGDEETTTGETDACQPMEGPATIIARPADVLVLFSNADTMDAEAPLVAGALNGFVDAIDASLQPQVALLSGYPSAGASGLCIDPPLGGGACPDTDANEPSFAHVDVDMFGPTALSQAVAEQKSWSVIQREGAVTHVVVIADDDTNDQVDEFDPAFSPLVGEYVVHVSVPGEDPADACKNDGACCDIAIEDAPDYIEHAEVSGGIVHDMCEQAFDTYFADVADVINARSPNKCRWEFPEGADPDQLNLLLEIDAGAPLILARSPSLDACDAAATAWVYDDPANPTLIELCPASCNSLDNAVAVIATIQTGCPTIEQ